MTYGKTMAIEGFFSAPDIPEERVGGYYVQGHDKDGVYQDFVVVGRDNHEEIFERIAGWHDMIRSPIEIGNVLLETGEKRK